MSLSTSFPTSPDVVTFHGICNSCTFTHVLGVLNFGKHVWFTRIQLTARFVCYLSFRKPFKFSFFFTSWLLFSVYPSLSFLSPPEKLVVFLAHAEFSMVRPHNFNPTRLQITIRMFNHGVSRIWTATVFSSGNVHGHLTICILWWRIPHRFSRFVLLSDQKLLSRQFL